MSKIFLDKDNNVIYDGYETHEVVANPTLVGTEEDLTGLKIGDTKYKISGGGESPILKVTLTKVNDDYVTDYTNAEISEAVLSGKIVYIHYNMDAYTLVSNIIQGVYIETGEEAVYSFRLMYEVDQNDEDDSGIIFDYDNQKFIYFYTQLL